MDSSGGFDETRAATLAQQLLDLRRYDEAARVAWDMLAHRESATALVLLSFALRSLGRDDEAVSAAQRATTLQPDHLGAWTALALAHSALGGHTTAIAAAEERVRLAPHDSFGHVLKSEMIDAWWPAPEGLAAAEEAVRLAPNSAPAHRALGNAYLRRRSRRKARSSFQQALRLDAQAHGPRLALATLKMASRPGSAASELLDIAGARPQDPLVTYNLRVALARILAGAWYVVLAGGLLSFVLFVVRIEGGVSPTLGSLVQVMIAVVVGAAVALLCGRVLRSDRARKALRFALAADRSLVVQGSVLLTGIGALFALALVPPPVQAVVLVALYPALWGVSIIAILAWRAGIDADKSRQ